MGAASRWLALGVWAVAGVLARAEEAPLRLPSVFGDHMVLQQGQPVPVWGWTQPGGRVTVAIAGQEKSCAADSAGAWRVTLNALKAGGPLEMTVTGAGTHVLQDILVGEVWLCSGQSNMRMSVVNSANGRAEVAAADHPRIRLLMLPTVKARTPAGDIKADWRVCSSNSVRWFSAVAYHFAREIRKELGGDVPVGLINATWGASRIEPWTVPDSIHEVPALRGCSQQELGQMYNGMIAPLVPFGLRGILWYQGEANVTDGMAYAARTQALVQGWRNAWGRPDLPFGYVQLAPYGSYPPGSLPNLWEAQSACLRIPHTGMAVINDIGNPRNVHPANKQEVGRRLALWALANVYGQKDLVFSGPVYKGKEVRGGQIVLRFDHVGGGLAARDNKPLGGFAVSGADWKFVKARAVIQDNTVIVSGDQVPNPVNVRFAWNNTPSANLVNKEGLPASAFRTDQREPGGDK